MSRNQEIKFVRYWEENFYFYSFIVVSFFYLFLISSFFFKKLMIEYRK